MADPSRVPASDDEVVPYIAHEDFRAALNGGGLRIVVDPEQARPYVLQRTRGNALFVLLIGIGCALALAGQVWPGGALVALGIAARRLVLHQAPRIVLHLAATDPVVYAEVTGNGVMEVRRAP